MSFEAAHKSHNQNLCSCLENSLEQTDLDERLMIPRKDYHPLIFQPNFDKIQSFIA